VRPRRSWLWRLTLVALGLFVVLLLSGLYLTFRYRPVPRRFGGHTEGRGFVLDATVIAHRIAADLFVATTVVVAVLFLVRVRRPLGRAFVGATATLLFAASVAAAVVSGTLLPWDQLALYAVTIGNTTDPVRGVLSFPPAVKYVLIGTSEVSPSTYSRTAWLHVLVIPLVIIGTAGAMFVAARTGPRTPPVGATDIPSVAAPG
jgi:quinol-cytochrome oxidoreductase complex cytochrome b subunit